MAIQILNTGANIKIVVGDTARLIAKTAIKSVRIVGDCIKLHADGCCGSPFDYLPYSEVTAPVTSGIEALRDAIGEMLASGTSIPGMPAGISTEVMQVAANDKLDQVISRLTTLNSGKATAANQVTGNNQLGSLLSTLSAQGTMHNTSMIILGEIREYLRLQPIFQQPLRTHNASPTLLYEGFAVPGTRDDEPLWAIRKSEVIPDGSGGFIGVTYSWALGSKNFIHLWTDRLGLGYW